MTKSRKTHPARGKVSTLALLALNWLAEHDRRHREAQKLSRMPKERLLDMGMSQQDVEDAFCSAPAPRRHRAGIRKARLS